MAETTTIKLPAKLKSRIARVAKKSGRSPHSVILEAIEKHAAREEQIESFVKEALAAGDDIEKTGEMYRAEEVHAWLERLAKGGKATRPKPWRQ